jgi:hypothetical protein
MNPVSKSAKNIGENLNRYAARWLCGGVVCPSAENDVIHHELERFSGWGILY